MKLIRYTTNGYRLFEITGSKRKKHTLCDKKKQLLRNTFFFDETVVFAPCWQKSF